MPAPSAEPDGNQPGNDRMVLCVGEDDNVVSKVIQRDQRPAERRSDQPRCGTDGCGKEHQGEPIPRAVRDAIFVLGDALECRRNRPGLCADRVAGFRRCAGRLHIPYA